MHNFKAGCSNCTVYLQLASTVPSHHKEINVHISLRGGGDGVYNLYHSLCLSDTIQPINASWIEQVTHFEEKKYSVNQVNLNYSIFASEKITAATISTKSRERTAKSIFAKRENFVFCTEVISAEWVISIFMLAELKDQKLKVTQKQIQNQRKARIETVVLKSYLVFQLDKAIHFKHV